MSTAILVVNAGSSSVKCALYDIEGDRLRARLRGLAEGLPDHPHLRIRDEDGRDLHTAELPAGSDQQAALDETLRWLESRGDLQLAAVGHRVVHGGPQYSAPVRIDDQVLTALDNLIRLAPLHQPHNLKAIRAVARLRPDLPQVACFDTAFHRAQPETAQRFALPPEYFDKGVLRYGFHGLSYEYIAGALAEHDPEAAAGRTIVAHLGNGASMCGLMGGRSVASTMGFTTLDGLPMGQRCGSIDPGVVLYLLQQEGMSVDEVENLLYRRSGLLGMSGVSADMRKVQASDSPEARVALEHYVYRARREIGSLAAALGGADALVFTAGIGENAADIRERVCGGLRWLGLDFDHAANSMGGPRISAAGSRLRAWVIPTDEEGMIARHTRALLGA